MPPESTPASGARSSKKNVDPDSLESLRHIRGSLVTVLKENGISTATQFRALSHDELFEKWKNMRQNPQDFSVCPCIGTLKFLIAAKDNVGYGDARLKKEWTDWSEAFKKRKRQERSENRKAKKAKKEEAGPDAE